MTIGEKLQYLRKRNRMSQEQLAEKMNVTRQTISKWELNQSSPDLESLCQLSRLFDVSIDSMVKPELDITIQNSENFVTSCGESKKRHWIPIVLGMIGIVILTTVGFFVVKEYFLSDHTAIIGGADAPTELFVIGGVFSWKTAVILAVIGLLCCAACAFELIKNRKNKMNQKDPTK